jgi:beta-glucanase (GH16 family)
MGSQPTSASPPESKQPPAPVREASSAEPVRDDSLPAPDGGRFHPSWSDEFDGSEIDPSKWLVAEEFPDMGKEMPWRRNWKPSNVFIEEGALVIQTIKDGDGYSTGGVRTGSGDPNGPQKFRQAFGRFEARIMPPKEQGHWSAFWMMTGNVGNVDGSGRDGTEIDIIEFAYRNGKANHALHWDGYGKEHKSEGQDVVGMNLDDGGWHTVTLEWMPDEYVFYVDGKETWRTKAGGVSQESGYLKLTEEIGNSGAGPQAWGVGPISEAKLPDYFRIDYVRVWRYEPPAK